MTELCFLQEVCPVGADLPPEQAKPNLEVTGLYTPLTVLDRLTPHFQVASEILIGTSSLESSLSKLQTLDDGPTRDATARFILRSRPDIYYRPVVDAQEDDANDLSNVNQDISFSNSDRSPDQQVHFDLGFHRYGGSFEATTG
jgi:hypothetical protein